MLGDKAADMQAAATAGVGRKVLVLSGQSLSAEDRALADEVWASAHDAILLFKTS
jgi:D-glycero-D-manno-heptose 1,7-bisphosphate phosphatase